MTNARLIGPERTRQMIPEAQRKAFEWLTNDELAWLYMHARNDRPGDMDAKTYAGWELDYRIAAGIEVYLDVPAGGPMEAGKHWKEARIDPAVRFTNDIRRRQV